MSDLISRQAALEKVRAMQTYKLFVGDDMILVDKAEVQTELMMLPSAQPERKKGKWIPQDHNHTHGNVSTCIYFLPVCSECGHTGDFNMNYCSNCGADMRGDSE